MLTKETSSLQPETSRTHEADNLDEDSLRHNLLVAPDFLGSYGLFPAIQLPSK